MTKLSPGDFFKRVLDQIQNLNEDQREKLLAAANTPRGRVEAIQAVIQELTKNA